MSGQFVAALRARTIVASFEVEPQGREADDDMTKPFTVAFKHKMVQRVTEATRQVARRTGIPQ
jgi:hypothetical protein